MSCDGRIDGSHSAAEFVDTTKIFTKNIPTYKNGKFVLWYTLAKSKEKQLGLENIDSGFDNLQIRVWTDFSFRKEQKLTTLTNKGNEWIACIYNLNVDLDDGTEIITSKKIKDVIPQSGWTNFLRKLFDLNVMTLPNGNDLPGYSGQINDGNTYYVEIATKKQYRLYSYTEPGMFTDKYWQAKNMNEIISLLEAELGK